MKVIVTGEHGSDEKVLEGEAMAKYACENGMQEENIIIEDKAEVLEEPAS